MSLYVQWLNTIKERSTSAWLTDAQRSAYDKLTSRFGASLFVNLHGPAGCGKSFIGRLLAREQGFVYTHDLQAAPSGSANVILDDAEYTRLMRPTAQLLRLGRVILLTRHPVQESMPKVELRLTDRDVAQFLHNLHVHCGLPLIVHDPHGTDLAQIIRAEAIARGGTHVNR